MYLSLIDDPLDIFPYQTKPWSQTHYIHTICLKQNYQLRDYLNVFMDVCSENAYTEMRRFEICLP